MLFYSKNTYIYTTGITLIGKQFVTEQIAVDIYRYIVGMAGVVSVVFWTKILYHKVCDSSCKLMISMRKNFEKFGNDSLIYYILSTYLFVWLMPNVTAKFQLNYITVFVETLIVMICNRSIIPRYRKAVVPSTHTAENHDFISSDQGSRSSTSKSLLRSARSGNMLSR